MTGPALLVLCGPPAVGKMTVGQELARLTGMKLLYNHQVIDLLTPYFEFGSPSFERLARLYERELLAEAAKARLELIFTWGWRFNVPGDTDHMRELTSSFVAAGGVARVVELAAPIEVRLERNRTGHRRATSVWTGRPTTPSGRSTTAPTGTPAALFHSRCRTLCSIRRR